MANLLKNFSLFFLNSAWLICSSPYANGTNQQISSYEFSPAQPIHLTHNNSLTLNNRNDDKTLYNRNYYRYDWDYRDNWRHDKEDYLRGGTQAPIYRRNGSYAPDDEGIESYRSDSREEDDLAYIGPTGTDYINYQYSRMYPYSYTGTSNYYYSPYVTPYTNYSYIPTGTSYPYPYAGMNPYYAPLGADSPYPFSNNYIYSYPGTNVYSSSSRYPYSATGINYGDNRYFLRPNSNLENRGIIHYYNTGINHTIRTGRSAIYQNNTPYDSDPRYDYRAYRYPRSY